MSTDLFGHAEAAKTFRDISNTRPTIAEEKAALALVLSRLCRTAPPSVRDGSIDAVRHFTIHLGRARKTLAKESASISELQSAIRQMESFYTTSPPCQFTEQGDKDREALR